MKFNFKKHKLPYPVRRPAGLTQYINDSIAYPIVYNRYKKEAYCCGCEKKYKYAETIYADKFVNCPYCGNQRRAIPHSRYFFLEKALVYASYNDDSIKIVVADIHYRYEENWEVIDKIKSDVEIIEELFFSREKQEAWHYSCFTSKFRKDTGVNGIRTYIPHDYTRFGEIIHHSVEEALSKGFLKYVNLNLDDAYDASELAKLIYVYSKYPQTEYLKKLGFEKLIYDRVRNITNHIRTNWRGTNIEQMLGITKDDLAKLKQWGYTSTEDIGTFKFLQKYQKQVRKKDMEIFYKTFSYGVSQYKWRFGPLKVNPIKVCKYVAKLSIEKNIDSKDYYYKNLEIDYADYLDQLEFLDYPKDDYYLYPKDFDAAHDRMTQEVAERKKAMSKAAKAEKNKEYRKAIYSVKPLSFTLNNLMIRPLMSVTEQEQEGKKMHHCVASYIDKVIQGRCYIFTVRDVHEPKKPIATLELSGDKKRIVQLRGKGNAIVSDEIKAFCDYWFKNIVNEKAKKGRKAS